MALPTVDEVQTAILKALDASPAGTLDDSRKLSAGGTTLESQEAQAVVKSALDSLLSKEVSRAGPPCSMGEAGCPISCLPLDDFS
jgi:hypothetical protein